MPGILPMKVIKVGTSAQSRIAQACDRCRSKKIRCDGIRPSCTQCVNVGFECKTSDKLSRRAFPRGYTESLEERVRALELEVRELKDLLDEKDEKIDMLTRIHSHSPHSTHSSMPPRHGPSQSPMASIEPKDDSASKDEVFKVLQSPSLTDDQTRDSYFVGTSSGRTLVDAFKRRVQETGKPCCDIQPEALFNHGSKAFNPPPKQHARIVSSKAPPRLLSDQLINIYFQEWAPLFPVLHRPAFLALYEQYTSDPEAMTDKKSLAQLNLVFSIATLSIISRHSQGLESFDLQWQSALETLLMDNSMTTLQCLVLAQISCLLRGDCPRLLKYKGLAFGLSQRLGLHQSQKRFALGALAAETRKKVFWTLYVVDCFSAAQLGVPRMLREEDIHCEYPVDADDEYITEKGFLPTLPGESTKLSSALALFRACRVLAKALTELYPSAANAEISFRSVNALSEELDAWFENLAPHLRLQFAQDKPSTNVISSRSPILSLMYHYIRMLIYRPVVCAGLGDRGSSATLALSSSSKHIIQIVQLLEERTLGFSLALNKNELMLLCGFGLLFQSFTAERHGKLYKDCQRMVTDATNILERSGAPVAQVFRRITSQMLPATRIENNRPSPHPSISRHNSDGGMPAPNDAGAFRATQKHLKAIAQCFSPSMSRFSKSADVKDTRRATVPNISAFGIHGNKSAVSISSIRSEPTVSPLSQRSSQTPRSDRGSTSSQAPNLDYLAFEGPPSLSSYQLLAPPQTGPKAEVSISDWERLLGSLDNGQTNIYDTIYGGQLPEALLDAQPTAAPPTEQRIALSPDIWNLGVGLGPTDQFAAPQSVLSFSDESLTSGEEFPYDFGGVGSDSGTDQYASIIMPAELSPLGGLDAHFNM